MAHFTRTKEDGGWLGFPPPVVSTVSPNTGSAAGFEEVVITGVDFDDVVAVYFGNRPADSFVVDSNTQITAFTPLGGSPGVVDVSVYSSYLGRGVKLNAFTFT